MAATSPGAPTPQRRHRPSRQDTVLPGPLAGATRVETATLAEVPTADKLAAWLKERGVSTAGWGEGTTKSVGKLFKELKLGEAGIELWRTKAGDLQVLRATHVLRGKVCSETSYERGVFLFNTWQQFSDGRKRTRNGLLSEKLSTSEVPLEDHLHEVCKRAVEEEEMQRVVDAAFTVGPGSPAPEFDPCYRCPLRVEREIFVDYTIEVEESKSFPGLLTAYHLYTVDIVCSGLPGVDFNTLEFEEPDEHGSRRLKYIHAWNWLNWVMIQRYLFEGSTLKETKRRGSFEGEADLQEFIEQLGVDTEMWGKDGFKSVGDLLREVEKEEAQLELWGRHDGVPLLMRVVHVVQLKVVSNDPRLAGKFLFQTWQQSPDGRARSINRLMSKKLSCAQVPFDETRFQEAATLVVNNQLKYLADVHFQLNPAKLPKREEFVGGEVRVHSTKFEGHHFDIEESPSFKGMHTMYHLYTMELECEGLPLTDFSSVDFGRSRGPFASGWRWVTLPGTLDILHAKAQALEREDVRRRRVFADQRRALKAGAENLSRILATVQGLGEDHAVHLEENIGLRNKLHESAVALKKAAAAAIQEEERCARGVPQSAAEMLPPAMLSKMASDTITSETFLEEAMIKQVSDAANHHNSAAPRTGQREPPKERLVQLLEHSASLEMKLRRRSWAIGMALGLCLTQAIAGSVAASRARAAGSSMSYAAAQVLGGLGIGLLLLAEVRARENMTDAIS